MLNIVICDDNKIFLDKLEKKINIFYMTVKSNIKLLDFTILNQYCKVILVK